MTAPTDETLALVDTNILIYAYDLDEPTKHNLAVDLIEELSATGRLVLSVQVFNEFCSVMMKSRRARKSTPAELSIILRELESLGPILPITPSFTFRALDAMTPHGLSFWDAVIWAAAAENGIPTLYTEDFQARRIIDGVHFVNPFVIE